jgi:hypothetical protein
MGNGEGSSAGGATRRKEGAQARSCHAEEDGIGGGGWQGLAPARTRGRWRRGPVSDVRAGRRGWHAWAMREGVGRPGKGRS